MYKGSIRKALVVGGAVCVLGGIGGMDNESMLFGLLWVMVGAVMIAAFSWSLTKDKRW